MFYLNLIELLKVLWYAHWTVKKTKMRAPWWKLCIIPIALFVSTPLFFGAWAVARSPYGRTRFGAKIKFILWGVGLLVEGVSHIRMSRISWLKPNTGNTAQPKSSNNGPEHQADVLEDPPKKLIVPYSNVKTRSRLEAITTIILGEVSNRSPLPGRYLIFVNGLGDQRHCRNAILGYIYAYLRWSNRW